MKLYEKTAHELAKMIRAKETTVPEIIASVFENIEKNEQNINAYITLTKEEAFAQSVTVLDFF